MKGSDQAGGNAPSWLFSFVDLAFLLLIAMTQLRADGPVLPLGEMIVPSLRSEATNDLPQDAPARTQLRVHPPEAEVNPYELVGAEALAAPPAEGARISLDELRDRLARMRSQSDEKPVLAPHEDSRSQDLLDAVDAIEEQWPNRRRVTVERRVAQG